MARRQVGACFDIDGVVLRGAKLLDGARASIQALMDHKIPVLFMTNGGGHLEERKAAQLSGYLRTEIRPDQVVLAHSPMRSLVDRFHNKRVMILGCREELQVAKHYGFEKVVSPQQFCAQHPEMYPFRATSESFGLQDRDEFRDERVEGILIMHDPTDWHLEVQACIDVLLGHDPFTEREGPLKAAESRRQCVPVFNSNEDFVFSGGYSHPRFAQGAFLETLSHLFKLSSGGIELDVGRFGKPHKVTFEYAEDLLQRQVARHGQSNRFDLIFMIGDNIHADVKGANNRGHPWHSVLVETGVYRKGMETGGARTVLPGIKEAVDMILHEALKA